MGQLIDGVWHDTWYDTMARQAPLAQAVLSQRKIVIISMFHSPARGRTAR